ncbi:MAG: ABC transporter ATP-binding protein [Alphaproteobacteria bacterium]|nr:ABC transporter ATP-binding protein [Alphaproteobacteria bacterium]
MASINLQAVSVEFPIYDARTRSLKNRIIGAGAQALRRIEQASRNEVVVRALSDITLSLKDGDRIGLVGRNGAGKTTLLRVLSGIYEPPIGTIDIQGSVSSMTDITMGMDSDATGYDNIVMRGIFLGMSRAEARGKIPEIEEFTELGEHLSLPIRTYSTGMMLRLAFAISTCIQPEILIMDEMINAGDAHFMDKAKQRANNLVKSARILAIASHSADTIRGFCNKALLLHNGKVLNYGTVDEIMRDYNALAA